MFQVFDFTDLCKYFIIFNGGFIFDLLREHYWFLTNDGIEFLRTYLNLPSEIVPDTLKKSAQTGRAPQGDRPWRNYEGGDRPRFGGDRDGYRGGPRRGAPEEFGGDKGGCSNRVSATV
ncbi:hypothetical protein MKW98_025414 [Papaver atlanticum]|uniref:Plectin/eS10 N-terminal domain-containing protein n=1 Tax=Papaver atlanticum TaxID=357466 RepID=A0AAD4SC45_9MAGN|nr:hypothetical protein MKW98_025414 [Papaver atlanticum]